MRRSPFLVLRSLAAMTLLGSVLLAPAEAQHGTPPSLGGPTVSQNERAGSAPRARVTIPKLDSPLAATARIAREAGEAAALQAAQARSLTVRDGRVRAIAESTDPAAVRAAIRQARGTVEAQYDNLVQVLLPPTALEAVAQQRSVRYLRLPARAVPLAVSGEGPTATGANAWTSAGVTGAGVKVAVIDVGFKDYPARQASGDLPANLTTADFCSPGTFTNSTEHGTAVAEILYEMAPGAQLHLVCVETEVNLGQAKDYVKAQGIPIVNHSVAWFNANRGDGSGAPTTPNGIVADARASGILWVNAAGNSGQRHWSGTFSDPNGNGYHNFTAGDEGNTVVIAAGREACFALEWDRWPATTEDYDLHLYRSADFNSNPNPPPVAVSINDQAGETLPPIEYLCYTNTGPTQNFALFIVDFQTAEAPRIDLWSLDTNLEHVVAAGSVEVPASSPHAFAAGAVCWQSHALEPYSSQGPTIDGRVKPDIVAPAAVSSGTYGPFTSCAQSGFTGTSAAAPHLSGAAALVKQANPTFTAAQLQSVLTGRAIDQGSPGVDNLFGAGRLHLGVPGPAGTIGGRDFTLQLSGSAGPVSGRAVSTVLTWADGTVETGYIVIRWSPTGGVAFLPRDLAPLAASATTYTDTEPLTDEAYCYLVMAVSGTPPVVTNFLGFSDFLCLYPAGASGTPPTNVKVQLNQGNTATLAWTAPGGQTGYDLVVHTFTGAPPQTISLGNVTNTTHNTNGQSTCYELRAKNGASIIGMAPKVCAVPGIYGTAPAGGSPSLAAALARARGGLPRPGAP